MRRFLLVALCVSLVTPSLARADEPTKAPSEGDIETAKDLFRKGVALFEAGDIERALDFFLRSRAAFASSKNTLNAAICLERLGRADEAIELYEEVLTKFPEGIDPTARQGVISATAALRKKVGSIDVSANVDGMLVIDGRMRGKLPLVAPVRVLPGSHVVRVIKDGWDTFQQTVKVEVGQTVSVDAKLAPLTTSGKLRVEAPGLEGGTVFIDGAAVGDAPWEGTLAPGPHLFFVQRGELGSDPRLVTVLKAQATSVKAEGKSLGVAVRIVVEPSTAQLSVDGVPLGAGRWEGRLSVGMHQFAAREEGYLTQTFAVASGAKAGGEQLIRLKVDRDHPRWAVKSSGRFFAELQGGAILGSSLASGAESACDDGHCTSSPLAKGYLAVARFGYELPARVSVVIGLGYLSVRRDITRTIDSEYKDISGSINPITYTVRDRLHLNGPLATAGVGYRLALGRLDLGARLQIGVGFVSVRDAATATATARGRSVDVDIANSGTASRTVMVLGMPEIYAGLRFGSFDVRLALTAMISVAPGPRLENGQTTVAASCPGNREVECAPGTSLVAHERAFGQFLLWAPQLGVGWSF